MSLYKYKTFSPTIEENVFIAKSAEIIGRSHLSKNVNIWFNTVVRGDINKIEIGKNTNVQDLCLLHTSKKFPLIIGCNVSIGHNAILHACTVEHSCLIGMSATILDGAIVGKNSIVAAGSLVPPGKVYEEGSMIMGSPAVVTRKLTESERFQYGNHYKIYLSLKEQYLDEKIFSLIKSERQ